MTKEIIIDTCVVCGVDIIKTNSRQMTCLSVQCQKEWKSGVKVKKAPKVYRCLKCGNENTTGRICKDCRKSNAKIQDWESWS